MTTSYRVKCPKTNKTIFICAGTSYIRRESCANAKKSAQRYGNLHVQMPMNSKLHREVFFGFPALPA